MKTSFYKLSEYLFSQLKKEEYLTLDLFGEESHFVRINKSKIRQSGVVKDAEVTLKYVSQNHSSARSIGFSGIEAEDLQNANTALETLRKECSELPEDPFAIIPKNNGTSDIESSGELLNPDSVFEKILPKFQNVDLVGFYQSGPNYRGNANSMGQRHWFKSDEFSFDYSIVGKDERAVKASYAGKDWKQSEFEEKANQSIELLKKLETKPIKLDKGTYRAYLAPAALFDIMHILSWDGFSESAFRQGRCGLRHLKSEKSLSSKVTIQDSYTRGNLPRFNSDGEVSPETLILIENGKLKSFLVNTRTAKEYNLESNFACDGEFPRNPEILPGLLKQEDILKSLDTGVYLSNLHYLNWSDRVGGRITGMTRYACFWVEDGEIKAPIENMRFDECIYDLLGENLEDLTDSSDFMTDTGTYGHRALGGVVAPGLLTKSFHFTL